MKDGTVKMRRHPRIYKGVKDKVKQKVKPFIKVTGTGDRIIYEPRQFRVTTIYIITPKLKFIVFGLSFIEFVFSHK